MSLTYPIRCLPRIIPPNRLERAKLAISRVVDKLRDDRLGLIVFAGNSFVQLPITADYVSAKMFLNTISTESVPVQGTAIGDAINTAIRSFSSQSDKSRAIIVITDGENHEDDPVAAARQAAEWESVCSYRSRLAGGQDDTCRRGLSA